MPNPNIPQGTLSRVRGSVTFTDNPQLNITAPFLGVEGINITLEGDIVDNIGTMTGTVTSPAVYQMATIECELLKTQSFADLFKQTIEDLAVIGDFVVRLDSSQMSNYQIKNGNIYAAGPGRLNGKNVSFMVGLRGFYQVNPALFDGI